MPTFIIDETFPSLFPLLSVVFTHTTCSFVSYTGLKAGEMLYYTSRYVIFFMWSYSRIHFTELRIPTCMFANPVTQFYHWETLSFTLETVSESSGRGRSYYSDLNHSIHPPVTFTIMVVLFLHAQPFLKLLPALCQHPGTWTLLFRSAQRLEVSTVAHM